jgi:peroxiredoxin Q/BCP
MRLSALFSLLVSVVAMPAVAALEEGDHAPEFTTQASFAGKAFSYSLRKALDSGTVVVYFYPAAYTGGCNVQAHAFAVNAEEFAQAGASIVGVSLDNIQRLNDFSADPNYCAGKFPTASDADGAIAKSYGLSIKRAPHGVTDSRGLEIGHDFTERTTFIVTPDGRVSAVIGGAAPEKNVELALQTARQINGDSAVSGGGLEMDKAPRARE